MIENGVLTVVFFDQTETRVLIEHVISLEEASSSDDSSDDYEGSVSSYVSVYDDEGRMNVEKEGIPIGYHNYYDSDENNIKSYESESSNSESSQSESSESN